MDESYLRMAGNKKIIKIGVDLDGVLADKPPLVPRKWLEYLFRGQKANHNLHYRYPQSKAEIFLRKFSHFYLFRPPIKENITLLHRLKKQGVKLYLISSRYSFLRRETETWLTKRKLGKNFFAGIYLNFQDEPPFIFKEKCLKKLSLDYYLEDDEVLVNYLKKKIRKTQIVSVEPGRPIKEQKRWGIKKRILFTLTYDRPNISGLTIYARRLAAGLVRRGFAVTIFSARYKKEWPQEEIEEGIRVWREKVHFRLGKGVLMLALPWRARQEVARHEVVVCHLPQLESFFWALTAKLKKRKLILVYHADLAGWRGINRLGLLLANVSHFISALCADKIVAYTKDYARHSYFLKFFRKKLVFILPPVAVSPPSSAYKRKLAEKLKGIDYKIGFSGRIAREKGIADLIKALPYLRKKLGGHSLRIVFAGPEKIIGENYRKEIEGLVRKYRSFLVFLGPLNQSQLSAFYQLLDVLVLPSTIRLESFGLVQVEAMLNGCPVVASNLPGIRVPVKLTSMGRLASPGNPRRLAAAIAAVVLHRQKYLFSRKAKQIFSLEKTIGLYEKLFS